MGLMKTIIDEFIAVDTCIFIYYIERHHQFHSSLVTFFNAIDKGELSIVTSTLTLTELIPHPLAKGADTLVQQYRRLLTRSRNVTSAPVTVEIAMTAGRLRAEHGLRTPDALQLATGITYGARTFLTNDLRIRSTPDIKVLHLSHIMNSR